MVVACGHRALAQDGNRWVGTEVVLESPDTALLVGSRVVATGRPLRLFRVVRVRGDWLWLESGAVSGWVAKDEAVLFPRAMEESDRAIATSREPASAYFRRGNLWLGKQQWARAAADYSAALQRSGAEPGILHNRGLAWSQLKDYDRAIADYSAAIQADPRYGWAYESRARVWAEIGSYDNAIADVSEALRLDPEDSAALQGRGLARVETKQFDAAIADLTEALESNPKLPRAHAGLGFAWKAKQEYARAAPTSFMPRSSSTRTLPMLSVEWRSSGPPAPTRAIAMRKLPSRRPPAPSDCTAGRASIVSTRWPPRTPRPAISPRRSTGRRRR